MCLLGSVSSPTEAKIRHHHKTHQVPAFSAKSFVVADETGVVIKEKGGDTIRPIASISKLMIGLIAADQNLNEILNIPQIRLVQSKIPKETKTMTRRELLTLALVKSDNFAAQILCLNLDNCVMQMNTKATELGMSNTKYVEPTGLDVRNVSTAKDLVKLVVVAASNPTITEISSMPDAEIYTSNKTIKIRNTNPLTAKLDILLSKTGFTDPAGGCLVMVLKLKIGHKIFVLLGSKNAHTRIPDMLKLIKEV
jgi:D-alanyl-D-alanine endopeptidase (penicillin-binding protein 7)